MSAGSTPANIALPPVPRVENAKISTFMTDLETAISNLYTGTIYPLLNNPFGYTTNEIENSDSPYTVLNSDTVLPVSAGSAAATSIILPKASGSGRSIFLIKIDSNAENVVANRATGTSDTIIGATTYVLSSQWQSVQLIDMLPGLWGAWT